MLEFDPIKISKRAWAMRPWGRPLVVATLLATGMTIVSPWLWFSGTITQNAVIYVTVALWITLILYYIAKPARLKSNLVSLIAKGEGILARLTGNTETDIDRHELRLREWDASAAKVLKGTEYEKSWTSDVGLANPEDEFQLVGLAKMLTTQRNYMYRRLQRLEEIKNSL